jgi:hypothetical protein
MKLNYKFTNRPTITTSQIVSSSLKDAMFYLYKEDDVVSFELDVKNPNIDLSSRIYSSENLKTVFKVRANTTDIMMTNVSIEDTPYYYEIKASDNSVLTLKDLTLNTDIIAKDLNGKLYTNTYINNYEIRDGIFIYSVATIDRSNYDIKYYSDDILVSIPKKKTDTLFAKTGSDNCISIFKINDNFIQLNSFYLKTRSKTFQYIEGDVVDFNKRELTNIENNFMSLKDKAVKIHTDDYLNPLNNTIYLSDSYLTSKEIIVEYVARKSSHMFEVEDTIYLKLDNNSIVVSDSANCDFLIKKKIDTSKFHLKTNDYLNTSKFLFKANRYGFLFNSELSEFKRKMFTDFTKKAYYVNPSQDYYILINGDTIYQEVATQDIDVKIVSKDDLYDYLEDDYQIPNIVILNKDKTRVSIEDHKCNYFKK